MEGGRSESTRSGVLEGRTNALSEPTSITIMPDDASLQVGWSEPVVRVLNVQGYRVYWTDAEGSENNSGELLPSNTRSYRIDSPPLTNGATYSVEVAATSDDGREAARSVPEMGIPRTTPEAPTSLSASAITSKSITVIWGAPAEDSGSPITSYEISWVDPTSGGISGMRTTTGMSYTITGLAPGTLYNIIVVAENSVGPGEPITRDQSTNGVPGAPQNLVVTDVTSISIDGTRNLRVVWEAPARDGGARVMSYEISWVDPTSGGISGMRTTTGMSYTITGLAPGTLYEIAVAAINSVGRGESTTRDQSTNGVPGAPQGLMVTEVTSDSIMMSWNAPAADGGARVTSYEISWVDPISGGISGMRTTTGMSYTITGLAPVTLYNITVAARNRVGLGAVEDLSTRTTAAAPEAPVLTIGDVGLFSIEVMWTVPTSNGATITAFNVYHSVGENVDLTGVTIPISISFTAGGATSYMLDDLRSGTTYTVAVSAVNAIDESSLSVAQLTMTITDTAPGAPIVTGPPVPGETRIAITWNAPEGADDISMITGYRIYWRTTNNLNAPSSSERVASSPTSYTIENLKPDTTYYIWVAAINDVGPGDLSALRISRTDTAAPEAPQSLVVIGNPASNSIEVGWEAPLVDNGEEVTAYRVYYKVEGSVAASTQSGGDISSLSTLSHRIMGLAPGTFYQISVSAVNIKGEGVAASTKVLTLSIEPPGIPGTPRVTVLRHDSITVEWAASIGGGAVANYLVYYRLEPPRGEQPTEASLSVSDPTTSATIPAAANSRYTISVSAESLVAGGRSESTPSGELEGRTNALSEPTSIIITAQDKSLQVGWSEPEVRALNIQGYRVYWTDAEGSENNSGELLPSNTRSYTIDSPPLTNGATYSVEVAATSDDGREAARSEAVQGIPRTVPEAVSIVSATPLMDRMIEVVWNVPANNGAAITTFSIYWGEVDAGESLSELDMYMSSVRVGYTSGSGSTANYTISRGLAYGRNYQIEIVAENIAGTGARGPSASARALPGVPIPAPSNLRVTAEDKALLVEWSAPEVLETDDYVIVGYAVYWTTNQLTAPPDSERSEDLLSDAISYRIPNLANGTGYWVEVVAIDEERGEGDRAQELSTPRTRPSQVSSLSTSGLDRMISVVWYVPADGGASISTFNIYWGESAVGDTPRASISYDARSGATTVGHTIVDLSPNTEYKIAVSAVNVVGEGPLSSSTTERTLVSKPGAPTNVNVEAIADTRNLRVVWDVPESGGEMITMFTVYWNKVSEPNNRGSDTVAYAGNGAMAEYTITNLAGDTTYTVTVSASNPTAGEGEESTLAIMARTAIVPPTVPTGVTVMAQDRELLVEWAEPDDTSNLAVDTYTVYWDASGNAEPPTPSTGMMTVSGSAARSTTITELINGKGYWVEVSATSSAGEGERSVAMRATPRTVPNQVILTNAEVVGRTINVEWEVPEDGGAAITGFRIDVSNASSATANQMEIIPVAYETVVSADEATASFMIDAIKGVALFGNTTYRVVGLGSEYCRRRFIIYRPAGIYFSASLQELLEVLKWRLAMQVCE